MAPSIQRARTVPTPHQSRDLVATKNKAVILTDKRFKFGRLDRLNDFPPFHRPRSTAWKTIKLRHAKFVNYLSFMESKWSWIPCRMNSLFLYIVGLIRARSPSFPSGGLGRFTRILTIRRKEKKVYCLWTIRLKGPYRDLPKYRPFQFAKKKLKHLLDGCYYWISLLLKKYFWILLNKTE